jgi:hypothetical protein
MANGYNLVTIVNSDTPDHTDILRFLATETVNESIRIAEGLGADAVFQDWEIESGVGYKYVARSYVSSGGFTDSAASSTFVNTLDGLWITLVTRDSLTTNAELALNLLVSSGRKTPTHKQASHEFKGRSKPVTYFGQTSTLQLDYSVEIFSVDRSKLAILRALEEADDVLCVRDSMGNKLFGRMIGLPIAEQMEGSFFSLSFHDVDFEEGV